MCVIHIIVRLLNIQPQVVDTEGGVPQQPDFDDVCMRSCQSGNKKMFESLVEKYQHILMNFFYSLGVSHVDAEDLTQETFIRIYKARHRYVSSGKFISFMYVIARNVWTDTLRRMQRTRKYEEERKHQSVDDTRDVHDVRLIVEDALSQLTDKLRIVIVLNMYQGLKMREIAEVLDIPEGTVKSRIHTAMNQLSDILGDCHDLVP